jgi:hypothetical protein
MEIVRTVDSQRPLLAPGSWLLVGAGAGPVVVGTRSQEPGARSRRSPNEFLEFPGKPLVILMTLRGGPVWFDECDLPKVRRYRWARAGGSVQGKRVLPVELEYGGTVMELGTRSHRVYLARLIESPSAGEVVIHRNGDRRDFRRDNLLAAPSGEWKQWKMARRPAKPGSFKGVFVQSDGPARTRPYRACIGFDYLGSYRTKEEAARAYDQAARARYGVSAWLNFPEGAER